MSLRAVCVCILFLFLLLPGLVLAGMASQQSGDPGSRSLDLPVESARGIQPGPSFAPTYTVKMPNVIWIGDDGRGMLSRYNGAWDFDYLSDAQRQEGASPQGGRTAHWVPGDVLSLQGWTHSPMPGNLPLAAVYDLETLFPDLTGVAPMAGGVLGFFDPKTNTHHPYSTSVMVAPPIYPGELGFKAGPDWILRCHVYASAQAAKLLHMVVGMRYDQGEGHWSKWIDRYVSLKPGHQVVTVSFAGEIPVGVAGVQFQVGGGNKSDLDVKDQTPVVDEVQAGNDQGAVTVTLKAIPDIDQEQPYKSDDESEAAKKYWQEHPKRKDGICQAGAYANCLWYWDNNGYDDLVPDTGDDAKDAAAIKEALAKAIYDEAGGLNTGVTQYLKDKKAYYDRKTKPDGLVHRGSTGEKATWTYLKDNFDAGYDVLLSITWHKEDGTLVDDLRHYLTLAGKQDPDDEGKGKIYVSNPWGNYRGVGEEGAQDAMDVEVNKDDRVRIKDSDLTKDVAGSDDAAYTMVDDVFVIRPGPLGQQVEGEKQVRRARVAQAGWTDYRYTITNTDVISIYHWMLFVSAPYTDVVSPPGWSWRPLPYFLPGHEGAPNWNTGSAPGILWSTELAPIQRGQALSGFGFGVDALCPAQEGALLYVVLSRGSTYMEHGSVFGPILPARRFLPLVLKTAP